MSVSTFQSYDAQSPRGVLKAKRTVTVVAPLSAAVVTSITSGATPTLNALPAGYLGTGRTTRDGITFPRETESDAVQSHGYQQPTREDRTSDTTRINVTFQQANARVMALYTGADPAALRTNATTGELFLRRAVIPADYYFRWLTISQDHDPDTGGEIWFGKYFPRVRVTEPGEQGFPHEGEVPWPVTLTAYEDPVAGYAVADFICGPGFKAAAASLGYQPAA